MTLQFILLKIKVRPISSEVPSTFKIMTINTLEINLTEKNNLPKYIQRDQQMEILYLFL
jgi:hypothetical protein